MSFSSLGRIFVRGAKWIDDRSTIRFEWVLNHLGLLRFVGFSSFAIVCLRVVIKLAAWVLSEFVLFLQAVESAGQTLAQGAAGGMGIGSLFDKINAVAPVVECFILLAGLAGLWCAALSFKLCVSVYKHIPFKAT